MAMADTFVRNLLNYFQLIFGIFFIFSFLLYFGIIFDNDYEARLSIPKPQKRRISKTGRLKNVEDSTHKIQPMKPSTNMYDVTIDNTGPILRHRHFIESMSLRSNSSVSDTNWNNTQVGQLATLTITVDMHTSPTTIFSVLAVGDDHIFAANQSEYSIGSLLMIFTFTPKLPGVYKLYVEEVHSNNQLQLPGSPFRLVVYGDPVHLLDFGRLADELPSCQTLSQTTPSWLDGEWITRKIAGTKRGVLRSGWIFQPRRCSFDIFTTEDLTLAAETPPLKTIAILGSSIDRGIFFSLLDLLLAKDEKYKLTDSDFSKCWGFAQVQVGNLKIVYQDFRVASSFNMNVSKDGKSEVICHDEKEAKSGNYDLFGEGMLFLSNYLFSKNPWPDVFLIAINKAVQLELLLKAIPSSWSGSIFPLYNFMGKVSGFYTKNGLEKSYRLAEKLLSLDNRIQLIDGFGVGSGMRHDTESSPLMIKSNHWHKWCNELNGEMRVCGNPTEMIAQVLLGKVLAPVGKEAWMNTVGPKTKITYPREITVCQDCPASLIPFHIKPNPNLTCYVTTEGILESSSDEKRVWDGTLCPEECLKMEPVDVINTESGPVNVRRCNLSLL